MLLCVPSCPVDGPAAEVVKAMRADRAIALQEKALPENHGAFAKKKKAPFVFVRNTADLPLAAPWAAALGVFPSGRVSDKVEEALRRQNAGSDILVLVRAN